MGVWKLERHGAVAVLTFNRPPQNMLDIAASDELAARLAELAQLTKDVRDSGCQGTCFAWTNGGLW